MRIVGLIFGIVFLNSLVSGQVFYVDSLQQVTQDSLFFSKPCWSPDGKSLLVSGNNNSSLYLVVPSQGLSRKITSQQGAGTNAFWIGNETIGYTRRNKIQKISLPGMKSKIPDDTIAMLDVKEKRIVFLNVQSGERMFITEKPANYYHPVLSPDKSKVVVHIGSEMYVYKTDGSGDFVKIGMGLASCWSPDSRYILFFIDKSSDGHTISNSDLYSVDYNGEYIQQITNTQDLWEMWPDISPNGKKIAFADQKTGRIYVANLRLGEK